MSVQINLLPDIRQSRIRAKNTRRIAVTTASVICFVSIGLVALLFVWTQAQRLRLAGLQKSIDQKKADLKAEPDLPIMITTQRNLAALPSYYSQRTYFSNLFLIMREVSPTEFAVNSIELKEGNAVMFAGRAKNASVVEKFVKALEAYNVTIGSGADKKNAPYFTAVATESLRHTDEGKLNFSVEAIMSQEAVQGGK